MILQCAEEQQAALGRILQVSIQNVTRDGGKDLSRFDVLLESLFETLFNFVGGTLRAKDFPVQIVLGGEMAEDHRLGNARSISDLTRGHTVKSMAPEELGRDL